MTVRCAVWGSPVDHSLSPVLHAAAYAALGLGDWTYGRRDVRAEQFPDALAGLDDSWRGLSLTMPLKEVALAAGAVADPVAVATGAANTLVRLPHRDGPGWAAHNTDVHGIVAALGEADREAGARRPTPPTSALLIGSGATARSAVAALARLGVTDITFMVRGAIRPETAEQARAAGIRVREVALGRWVPADVVISTVPPSAVPGPDDLPPGTAGGTTVLDVVYGEGRTPLQEGAARRGWRVAEGTSMLLHQAGEQVRLMTGLEAPIEAMRAGLAAARR